MWFFFCERLAPLLALLSLGAVLPTALLRFFGHKMVMFGWQVHFIGVEVSALVAAIAAIALTVVGVRRNDGRAVLVGTAFTVMAALLAIHGLATPGVLIGMNGVISLTGAATLPVGAAVLALSALPSLRRPTNLHALLLLDALAVAVVTALGVVGMAFPSIVPSVPQPASPAAIAALAIGASLFAMLVLRALKTYLLTHRMADLVVVVLVAWLTAALPPALLLNYMDLGWWLGHFLEIAGIVVVGVTVAVDLGRSAQSRSLVGDLRAGDLV